MSDVADVLHSKGWSQGDFLEGSVAVKVVTANIDHSIEAFATGSILVLLTQDCDIVKASATEPYLEFLVGLPVAGLDPLCQNGRNPRSFHATIGEQPYGFSIHSRVRVMKAALEDVERSQSSRLPTDELDQLRRWVSRRFLRPAGSDYGMKIILGYKTLPSTDEMSKTEAALESALAVPGIRLEDIVSLSEIDITLKQLRTYKRWDRDYRSLPDNPQTPGPPPQIDTV